MTYKPGGGLPHRKVGIHCPLCGMMQFVSEDCWVFQATEGHGYTCGSGKCPSHTYLELNDGELCAVKKKLNGV